MHRRLRSSNGCIECRRRRKKCDESRPACGPCQQRRCRCTWPPEGSRIDRRLRVNTTSRRSAAIDNGPPASQEQDNFAEAQYLRRANDVPTLVSLGWTANTQLDGDETTFLFHYCFKVFLPCQYHQPRLVGSADLSYLISLCLRCTFLRDAVMACALLTVPSATDEWQKRARERYFGTVREVSDQIAKKKLNGSEDELLGAVAWLCVFENSQLEGGMSIHIHLEALSKLLLLRGSSYDLGVAAAKWNWERQCVESFIYHTAIGTLYDSNIDLWPALKTMIERVDRWIGLQPSPSASTPQTLWRHTLTSPTLGAPADVYSILIEAMRLKRLTRPLLVEEEVVAASDYARLRQWQARLDGAEGRRGPDDIGMWMGKPYVLATRLLLLLVLVSVQDQLGQFDAELEETIVEVGNFLPQLESYFHRTWGKFLLWPAAVFGATAVCDGDINIIRKLLTKMSSRSRSTMVLPVSNVLEQGIWHRAKPTEEPDERTFRSEGLQILLDGQFMVGTAESLLVTLTFPHIPSPR